MRQMKIMIGNILRCPIGRNSKDDTLWMRTIIVNGTPMTVYAKDKKELEAK